MIHKVSAKCKFGYFLKQNKEQNKKQNGKNSPKEAETKPWETLCVILIGKYQLNPKGGGKKFQIAPNGDEEKFKMITKSGESDDII